MPPFDTPPKDGFFCGDWPMTRRRIENYLLGWKGTPRHLVPFGVHAARYALHLADGGTDNHDPHDAPWILNPRKPKEWQKRNADYIATVSGEPEAHKQDYGSATEGDGVLDAAITRGEDREGPPPPAPPAKEPEPAQQPEPPVKDNDGWGEFFG